MVVSPVEVQKYLDNINYPAHKSDLINHAKDEKAPSRVINALNKLPNKEFNSPTDITKNMRK